MAQYRYNALTRRGEKVSGIMEGFNELDAVSRIKETCSVILSIKEIKEGGDTTLSKLLSADVGGNKLNNKAFTVMCSQFAIILRSGVPIVRTVDLIADKTTDKVLKKLLQKVSKDVEAGRSVASAFEDHGKKFLPATFIETLRAGEESGNLDRSFQTMHDHFDKQMKMAGKVKGAMAYPMFILFIAVVVVMVLMVKVVPTFTGIIEEMGGEIPLMTAILIAISDFFRKYILVMIGIIAAVILSISLYGHTEKGKMNLAKVQLAMPVLGEIAALNGASQFANSMTTLLDSGLTLNKSVSITAKTMDNYYLSEETGKLSAKLEEGHTLGASMRDVGVLPDILVDMTAVGEATGELTNTLGTIALYYDAELEQAIQSALAKLEPALLIGLAGIAGFVVGAIYLSMFSMYAVMG